MKRRRCRATSVAVDGPLPVDERCVLVEKHRGSHECPHGFGFDKDMKRPLAGIKLYDPITYGRPRKKKTTFDRARETVRKMGL